MTEIAFQSDYYISSSRISRMKSKLFNNLLITSMLSILHVYQKWLM